MTRGAASPGGAAPSLAGGPGLLIGAAAWALTALYFPVEPYVAAAFPPSSYGFAANTISDLGSVTCGDVVQFGGGPVPVCSPRHAVMNAAFAVLGVLTAAGAVLTRRVWPVGRATAAGVVGVALAGVGAVLVALAPQDVSFPLHAVGAVLQLPGAVAPLALGLVVDRSDRVLRPLSLVLGAVGTLASLLFFGGTSLGLGVGAMERLAMWPLTAWTAAVGVLLLVRARRSVRVRVSV